MRDDTEHCIYKKHNKNIVDHSAVTVLSLCVCTEHSSDMTSSPTIEESVEAGQQATLHAVIVAIMYHKLSNFSVKIFHRPLPMTKIKQVKKYLLQQTSRYSLFCRRVKVTKIIQHENRTREIFYSQKFTNL